MKQARGSLTRKRIIEAAAAEVVEHGYAGTTFSSIAEKIGSTKGLVTYHFASKAAIAEQISIEAGNRIDLYDQRVFRGLSIVDDFFRWLADQMNEPIVQAASLLGVERATPTPSSSNLSEKSRRTVELALIDEVQRRGTRLIGSPDALAWTLCAAFDGLMRATLVSGVNPGSCPQLETWLVQVFGGISETSDAA